MREAFVALTRRLPEPMVLLDGTGAVCAANPAAVTLAGELPAGTRFAARCREPVAFDEWFRLCLRGDGALPVGFAFAGDGEQRCRGTGTRVRDGATSLVLLRFAARGQTDTFTLLADKIGQLNAEVLRRKQTENELAREAARLMQLQAITAALAGAGDVDAVSAILVEQTSATIGADRAAIHLVVGSELRLLSSRGLDAADAEALRVVDLDAPHPLCAAVRSERPLWIAGAADLDARFPEAKLPPSLRRPMVLLPLVSRGRVLGAAAFVVADARRFSADERTFVATIAQQCAQALDRALLFAGERHARQQAERLAEEARNAAERARDADRRKDEFLAILGHELRNPLAPILTALELMRLRGPDDVFAAERLAIDRQVRHLLRLVDDLLDIARITRGALELKRERLEVAATIARAVDLASPLLEKHGHEVTLQVPRDGLVVDVDPVRMAQALGNIIINAAKYTPEGGHITIGARRDGGDVVVSVRDTGEGIEPGMLPRIFEMFVQAPQAIDRAEGGLGIGLTLVRSIVEKHGGRVSAHSEGRGRGAEFRVRLPAAAPLLLATEVTLTPTPAPTVRRRVLIVDDNADAAELLAEVLQTHDHATRVAHDGPSALQAATELVPDVVLLDIGLPVMDGYEVAKKLRALPGLARVSIIAVTGYGQATDRSRSAAAGFDDHLTKPITVERVLQAIARVRLTAAARS